MPEWIHKIQTLGSQFREAALLNCNDGAREGIVDLANRLRNFCFRQGLASGRIQTIVRSRSYQNFDEIVETTLVEESVVASRQDRYRLEGTSTQRCGNCEKLGHASNKRYARSRGEAQVNPIVSGGSGAASQSTCFRCGEKGHLARNCRKPLRRREVKDTHNMPQNELRRTESSYSTVASTQ